MFDEDEPETDFSEEQLRRIAEELAERYPDDRILLKFPEDVVKCNRNAFDEPTPFPGRPRPGGAMDRRRIAHDMAHDARMVRVRALARVLAYDARHPTPTPLAADSAGKQPPVLLSALNHLRHTRIETSTISDERPTRPPSSRSSAQLAFDSRGVSSFAAMFPRAAKVRLG